MNDNGRNNGYSRNRRSAGSSGGFKAAFSGDRRKKNLIYIIVGGAALIALIVAAVILISMYADTANSKQTVNQALADAGTAVIQAADGSEESQVDLKSDSTGAVQTTPVENIREKLKIDFASLQKTNSDVMGWIYVHDTVINYPIVRGNDNEYYLTRSYSKQNDKAGAIFLDYRNTATLLEQNSTIYGHNMKNGSQFHVLEEYENQEFFDTHKLMFLVTPEKVYRLDVFSVFITNYATDYRTRAFATDAAYEAFIKTYAEKSMVKTDVQMTAKDKMVTLSTCDHQYSADSRIAVMAKLTQIDLDTYDFVANK